ncbi:hypothetical protein Tsubulata_048513 [Turnera subulata]|uniref:F-box domain-containing protein n=1 Tax=Turnera subulata TaxID=218843 RepID=A0A9Q0J1K3_9ROSI|nr:hypothetical protein Tsubulata_048513 [Turnera subulata]
MELIVEILTRVAVKDLLRFKCVSKEWKLLIEDRYFVHKHLYHSPIGRFPLVKHSFHFSQSYHGLILEWHKYSWKFRIRNPAMEQVFSVPNPQKASRMMRFGFAPTSGLYKLVSVYDSDVAGNGYGGVEILVLGTEDKPSWKHVDSTHLRSFDWNDRPSGYVADQGVVHIAKTSKIQSQDHEVMSFDLDTESFRGHKLVVPRSVFPAGSDVSLVYGAFLVALANGELHILGLQDCEEGKLEGKKIIIPLSFMQENPEMRRDLRVEFISWHSQEIGFRWENCIGFTYYIREERKGQEACIGRNGKLTSVLYKASLVTFKGMRPEWDWTKDMRHAAKRISKYCNKFSFFLFFLVAYVCVTQ